MKQPREITLLWVWPAFGLMAVGAATTYLAGYWMFGDMIARHRK